jgi:hypothetical protein
MLYCLDHTSGVLHKARDFLPVVPVRGETWQRPEGYPKHRSRSHDTVIRVFDEAGNVIETHEHRADFKEW